MGDASVGHRAANLPWLCPAEASLLALASEQPDTRFLSADPAAVLLLLRYTRPTPSPDDIRLDALAFSESILPEAAARHLASTPAGRLNLAHSAVTELLSFAQTAARVAADVAVRSRLVEPAAASVAALTAPLGWLLAAAVDPTTTSACRDAIRDGEAAPLSQVRFFGLTHDGVARRAADRWRLPVWLSAVISNLGLPPDTATRLGAPRDLFRVVQAAIRACEIRFAHYSLAPQTVAPADVQLARLAEERLEAVSRVRGLTGPSPVSSDAVIPIPALVMLLRAEARARRAAAVGRIDRIQADLDRALLEIRAEAEHFDTRIRDEKLTSLAELAAGAGHEINNPLAVISGNAQLLLTRECDPDSRGSLETIVRQCRRVSEIVQDLMQFARPRPPTPRTFDSSTWLARVIGESYPAARHRGVELRTDLPDEPVLLCADSAQLGRALAALIRNGIHAAETGGWVRVSVETRASRLLIAVEDSGLGPSPSVAEHMFDPFFSGRAAGRGRGLGLPTAWRLARENGGEVRHELLGDGPTRFVLEIPFPPQQAEPLPGQQAA